MFGRIAPILDGSDGTRAKVRALCAQPGVEDTV
jgi:hypothetical protein